MLEIDKFKSYVSKYTVIISLLAQCDGRVGFNIRVADVSSDTVSLQTCPEVSPTIVNSNSIGTDTSL